MEMKRLPGPPATHIRAVDEKNKRPSVGHPAYKVAALDGFNRL
jgi:hypothetical protein